MNIFPLSVSKTRKDNKDNKRTNSESAASVSAFYVFIDGNKGLKEVMKYFIQQVLRHILNLQYHVLKEYFKQKLIFK
jgi:hypothetical protein